MLFKKGKLVFTDSLEEENSLGLNIPYYTASALVITEEEDGIFGTIGTLNISDLILKTSAYVYDGTNKQEAHHLFTWPRNLGDRKAWSESKRIFLHQHVMNFPIQILDVTEENHITWQFITPEVFKKTPPGLQASPAFQNYLDHIDEYFFLRKDRKDPV